MKMILALVAPLLLAVTTTPAFAKVVSKSLEYEQGGVKCIGYLVYDDGITPDAKKPGVLVVPEWWGLTDYLKSRAREVAELGYVALAVDMYGEGKTTFDGKKAGEMAGALYGKPLMAERAQAGMDALVKTGLVDEKKIASIGFCFGGSTSMVLAESGAPLAAVVSFHGGPVPPSDEQAAKIKAPILILNGAADPMVPADKLKELVTGWEKSGQKAELVNYPGALHAFTNPEADKLAEKNGMVGKIGYNESAAKKSWAAMTQFLKAKLGE